MGIQDCIKFANDNPVSYLATVDGSQPRVRPMLFWFSDETGFYFQSGMVKELVGQLKKNPQAEACFFDDNPKVNATLRVAGRVEFLDSLELKNKACKDRPFLASLGITPESPGLVIFRIAKGEAYFWTMDTNLAPKKKFFFG